MSLPTTAADEKSRFRRFGNRLKGLKGSSRPPPSAPAGPTARDVKGALRSRLSPNQGQPDVIAGAPDVIIHRQVDLAETRAETSSNPGNGARRAKKSAPPPLSRWQVALNHLRTTEPDTHARFKELQVSGENLSTDELWNIYQKQSQQLERNRDPQTRGKRRYIIRTGYYLRLLRGTLSTAGRFDLTSTTSIAVPAVMSRLDVCTILLQGSDTD